MDKRKSMNCAECRRSKLKCDRKVPCSSCIKRGCANICPDGRQAATKGMKLIAAQEENILLRERIKHLELALHSVQEDNVAHKTRASSISQSEPLSPSPSNIRDHSRFDASRSPGSDEESPGVDGEDADPLDALGNLTIGEEGASTFHGTLAHTEYLLKAKGAQEDSQSSPSLSSLPADILQLADCFPYGPRSPLHYTVKQMILGYVPSPVMTWHMYELFYAGTSWLQEPVSRTEFLNQIYTHVHPPDSNITDNLSVHPHRLSVLFMIAALATLLDKSKPSPIAEAEEWHNLGKACISLQGLLEEPTIMGVQAVFLMVVYNYIWDRGGAERRWTLMGLVSKMLLSVGLHRDSARWGLDPAEVQRRRWIFWDICAYDIWMSFVYGRPPSLSLKHIDCQFPDDPDINPVGGADPYHAWRFRYKAHTVTSVTEVFGLPKCTYMQILQMDKAIRKCPVPPSLLIPGLAGNAPDPNWSGSLLLGLKRFAVMLQRESVLLLIHRAHFAQAIDDALNRGSDLFHVRYTPSILAVYRSSCLMIAGLRDVAAKHPDLVRRLWFLWTGPFTAGIVLGSLIIKAPSCNLAQGAQPALNGLVQLFENLKPIYTPDNALETLLTLQATGRRSLERARATGGPWNEEELEIKLPLLDGRTRLISRKRGSSSSQSNSSAASPRLQSLDGSEFKSAFGDVHPSVLEYFRVLDGASPPRTSSDESSHDSPLPSTASLPRPSVVQSQEVWPGQWTMDSQLDAVQVGGGTVNPFMVGIPFAQDDMMQGKEFSVYSPDDHGAPMELTAFNGFGDDGVWNNFMSQLGLQNMEQVSSTTF